MTLADEHIARQFDRLPPSSVEAERCVIASMVLDPKCIPVVRAVLQTDAFYQPDHGILFDVIGDLYDAERAVDIKLVYGELDRRKLLDEIGGGAHLAQILDAVPSAAHVEHYCEDVRDKWVWRQGIEACNAYLRSAYAPHRGTQAGAEASRKLADAMSAASATGYADGFRKVGDVAMDVYDRLGRKETRFIATDLKELDGVTGGVPVGGFTLIGGRPGMGKSQTARQIAHNAAARGVRAAIVTVEETDEKIAGNLLAAASGIANNRIMFGTVSEHEFGDLFEGARKLDRLPLWINDDPVTLSEVVAAVTIAATKYRCELVVVDYLQLIDPQVGDNENREITMVSRGLKAAFKRLDLAGIAAVQLNRGNEGQGGKEIRLPTLRDLRGSGSLEQDGDLIVLLHRNDYYQKGVPGHVNDNQIQAVVAKNKSGRTAMVPLLFNGDAQTVADWPAKDVFAGGGNGNGAPVRHARPHTAIHQDISFEEGLP
jgi:replicative DNA helicase